MQAAWPPGTKPAVSPGIEIERVAPRVRLGLAGRLESCDESQHDGDPAYRYPAPASIQSAQRPFARLEFLVDSKI